MFLGLGIPLNNLGAGGAAVAYISLSNDSVAETAAVGATVGTLSVVGGSGTYTFTETADPSNKFAIDGDDIEVDGALDYETATSHSYTVQADNGVDPVITRQFTIQVLDIVESADPAFLLEDGTSYLLLEDGTSHLLLE